MVSGDIVNGSVVCFIMSQYPVFSAIKEVSKPQKLFIHSKTISKYVDKSSSVLASGTFFCVVQIELRSRKIALFLFSSEHDQNDMAIYSSILRLAFISCDRQVHSLSFLPFHKQTRLKYVYARETFTFTFRVHAK